MGVYINIDPKYKNYGGDKEKFLADYPTLPALPAKYDEHKDSLVVILVDNGAFKAAAVVYCQKELEDWKETFRLDKRKRSFYVVPTRELEKHCGGQLERYMNAAQYWTLDPRKL